MPDIETVMSWLEGLAQDDWRQYYSDSEVQETAKAALALLMEVAAKPVQSQRCACGKLIVRRGDAHNCPYCGRRLEWDA